MKMNSRLQLKTLLKNSFLVFSFFILFFLVSCSSSNQEELDLVMSNYNVSLSDYENGLVYFNTHLREDIFETNEMNDLISQLENFNYNSEIMNAHRDFRLNLVKAEKQFKIASRKPFTNYRSRMVCSNLDELAISYNEVRLAINISEDAINNYEFLISKGEELSIDDSWKEVMIETNEELLSEVNSKERNLNNFCNDTLEENLIEE